MTERGGATTQSGILYQNSVAALYLGRLCDSTPRPDQHAVTAVRVEAPTAVDDIVVTYRDGHRTFIQAKENIRGNDSAWQKLWKDFEDQFWNADFQNDKDRLLLQIGEVHNEHHALREIGTKAATSSNHSEWISRLTQVQQRLLKKITVLFEPLHAESEQSLFFFKHFELEIRPLIDIERDLVAFWIPRSNRSQTELFRLLRDRVGGAARKRESFSLNGLRSSLANESEVILVAQPSLGDLREIVKYCGAGLKQHKRSFGNTGIHLKRGVVEEITSWALRALSGDGQDNVAILLDRAGMGKTVVSQDVLYALEEAGVTVLAIKADQISGITTAEELQAHLRLPDSVERVLQRLADGTLVVLLIDQIDALSLSLARDQRTLDVILDLVARLRLVPGIRVLMSCRTFDLNNTPSLKDVESKKFELAELTDEEVTTVLKDLAFPDAISVQLPPATRELLRTPLHLDLFTRALSESSTPRVSLQSLPHEIKSLQDLYIVLWQNVVRKTDPSTPSVSDREMVLRMVADEMNRLQRTTVSQSVLSNQPPELERAAQWLASQGILVPSGSQTRTVQVSLDWTFLHQTFFDYCYAKDFVERAKSLFQTIRDGDQGLFARPQLIHVLAYLRGTDSVTYVRELSSLLNASASEIRFHLRNHVLRWFGSVSEPTEDEWLIAQRMLVDRNRRPFLLGAAQANAGWFNRFKPMLELSLKFDDDEKLDKETIPFLCSMVNFQQADVVGMLRPYRGKSELWDRRIKNLTGSIRAWKTDEAIQLFEEIYRDAPFASFGNFYEVHELAKANPKAGCRVIRIAFDRILDEQISLREVDGEQSLWLFNLPAGLEILNGSVIAEALDSAAKTEPKYFLETMWPWLERVVSIKHSGKNDSSRFTHDALSDSWYGSPYVVHHQLNEAFMNALTELASTAPADFRQLAIKLESLPYATPQRYMAQVYTRLADSFTAEAFIFLTSDQRSFDLGDHQQYDSRQLITAILPDLTPQQVGVLEARILSYEPIHKYRGIGALRWRGLEKLYLLQCLPVERLTKHAQEQLRELERKFPGYRAAEDPGTAKGGFVGPPIPDDVAKKMSDKAWLRAMTKYKGAVQHKHFLKGGAAEQGAVLSRLVKEDPERFYRLAMQVPLDADPSYVSAFVNGLAESPAPAERTFDVVRRFASVVSRETRRGIAWALQKRVSDGLPADLLILLESYLHDEPGEDESWWLRNEEDARTHGRQIDLQGGPYSSYLNSVRGSAMMTLMRAFDHKSGEDAMRRKWKTLESVATDDSTALRAGALEELLYLLDDDRTRALSMFDQLMQGHPVLLRSHYADDFLYYAFFKNYIRMSPYILAMMNDTHESIQQRGAELACIAAISPAAMESDDAHVAAESLAQRAVTGSAPWRRGAAHVYALNIGKGSRDYSAALIALLNDDDEEVRKFASGPFGFLGAEHIVPLRGFIDAYAASRSLQSGLHDFTEFLWEHGPIDPIWALSVVEAVLNNPYSQESELRFAGGEELIRLVLRVYTDPTVKKSTHEKAMDLFDRLLEKFSWSGQRVLQEWDRR